MNGNWKKHFSENCTYVDLVVDCVDTTISMRTPKEHFEGFTLTIKEQLDKIKYILHFGVLTYPISTILTFGICGLPKSKIS